MENFLDRTRNMTGDEAVGKIISAKIAVFGVGGVGGAVVEALARAGVGFISLTDKDTVSVTNINRQLIATVKTVGQSKVQAAKERVLSINPQATVETNEVFFLPENADSFDFSRFDYIVDAVDTVSAKLAIVKKAKEANVPVISAMGAGNKLDPTRFEVADISKTSVCPLARVMRVKLRQMGIDHLKVVYSREEPIKNAPSDPAEAVPGKASLPGSISFVPPVMGYIMAGEVIKDLAGL